MRLKLFAVILGSFWILAFPPASYGGGGGENLLMLVNPTNESSLRIANAYAKLRAVPPNNVVYITPSTMGGYPLFSCDYATSFLPVYVNALSATISSRGLGNQIDYIATFGLPQVVSGSYYNAQSVNCYTVLSMTYALGLVTEFQRGMTGGEVLGTSSPGINPQDIGAYYRASELCQVIVNYDLDTSGTDVGDAPDLPYTRGTNSAIRHSTSYAAVGVAPPGYNYAQWYMAANTGNTGMFALSTSQVIANLQYTAAGDGTKPAGRYYFEDSGDKTRTGTRAWYWASVQKYMNAQNISWVQESGWWATPQNRTDVRGAVCGAAFLTLPNGSNYLPGSYVDNLTSNGGCYGTSAQTKDDKMLQTGAGCTAGTMTEPYATQTRFTFATVFIYSAEGSTLGEAHYKAIQVPDFDLLEGDLLSQAYADVPRVAFTSAPANYATVSGLLSISASAALTPPLTITTTSISYLELFVDGLSKGAKSGASATFSLSTTLLADGVHEIRAVAYNNSAAQSQGYVLSNIVVNNQGRSIVAGSSSYEIAWNQTLPVPVTVTPGTGTVSSLRLQCLGRVVASVTGSSSSPSLTASNLAFGDNVIVPVAVFTDGSQVQGPSVTVTRDFHILTGVPTTPSTLRTPGFNYEFFGGAAGKTIATSSFGGTPTIAQTGTILSIGATTPSLNMPDAFRYTTGNSNVGLAVRATCRMLVVTPGEYSFWFMTTHSDWNSLQFSIDGFPVIAHEFWNGTTFNPMFSWYGTCDSINSSYLSAGEHVIQVLLANYQGSGSDGDAGFTFWYRGPDGVSQQPGVVAQSTSAQFYTVPSYPLTMAASPAFGGSAAVTNNQSVYPYGTPVQIVATAALGYQFINWSLSGSGSILNATSATTTLTVCGDDTVTANFLALNLTGTTTTAAGGTIVQTPSGGPYYTGQVVWITASANAGWRFKSWSATGATLSSSTAISTSLTVLDNFSLTALFTKIPYTVTVKPVTGGAGILSSSQSSYYYGNTVAITAQPHSGFSGGFVGWTVSAGTLDNATSASTTLTVLGNVTLTPSFANQQGAVCGWGDNTYGDLGDNTSTQRNTPVQAVGLGGSGYLTGIVAVAAGLYHSAALKSDGTVWTWGDNIDGDLGDNTTTEHYAPVQVVGPGGTGYLTGVVAVTTAGQFHTVALKSDGTVWTWGDNYYGELGDNTTTQRNSPVQVKGPGGSGYLTGVVAVAAGRLHSVALKSDGTVWAWGENFYGELGDDTTTQRNSPVQVKGPGGSGYLTGVVALATGDGNTIAVMSDGTVWAWGDNLSGDLGDNTTNEQHSPVQVKGPGGEGYLTGVVAVSGGYYHTVALKSDGTVWAWGDNSYGELGDNTTTNRSVPVQVVGLEGSGVLTGIVALAEACGDHTVTLKPDGTIWAWGDNTSGQLGDNTTIQRTAPVQVVGPGGAGYLTSTTVVSAGNATTLALVPFYTLNLSAASHGSVAVTPSQSLYASGTVVTITAAANPGYTFASWAATGGTIDNSLNTSASLTITNNCTLAVMFTQNSYSGTETATNGTIILSSSGPYVYGQVITVTASAQAGYAFSGWSVTGQSSSTLNNSAAVSTSLTVYNSFTLTAGFTQIPYTLTAGASPGAGGTVTVTPSQATYHYGDTATISQSASPGYTFASWTATGGMLGNASGGSTTLTVQGNVTLVAVFTQDSYSGTETVMGGTIIVSSSGPYVYGQVITVTASAQTHYGFSGWSVTGSGLLGDAGAVSTTLTVYGDFTLTANFTALPYTVTTQVSPAGTGMVLVTPSQATYYFGDTITIQASASPGDQFTGWTVTGGTVAEATAVTTTLTVQENVTVTAGFTNPVLVTIDPSSVTWNDTTHIMTVQVVFTSSNGNTGQALDIWAELYLTGTDSGSFTGDSADISGLSGGQLGGLISGTFAWGAWDDYSWSEDSTDPVGVSFYFDDASLNDARDITTIAPGEVVAIYYFHYTGNHKNFTQVQAHLCIFETGDDTQPAILDLDDGSWLPVAAMNNGVNLIPPAATLSITASTAKNWVYQNTAGTTQDRHVVALTVSVTGDTWGNQSYTTTVTQTGPGVVTPTQSWTSGVLVTPATTAVWGVPVGGNLSGYLVGSRVSSTGNLALTGSCTVTVNVAGNVGGTATATVVVTVRPLGGIDGNGAASANDLAILDNCLNGLATNLDCDLTGDGAVTTADRVLLMKILNGVTP